MIKFSKIIAASAALLLTVSGLLAEIKIGVSGEPATRRLEELLMQELQRDREFTLLDRAALPQLTREISLQNFLVETKLEACDVLVLLNTFTAGAEPLTVMRVIATRDLRVLGLQVFPAADAEREFAALLARRVAEAAKRRAADGELKTVSLFMLTADTPALGSLSAAATSLLGAQIQSQPRLALLERWNVSDAVFEQWLRQTQPADLRAPDIVVEGALTEVAGKPALRLSVSGSTRTFTGSEEAGDPLALSVRDAAQFIAGGVLSNSGAELKSFEQQARWFWQWEKFKAAAAAADVAVRLGSADREVQYIRALAYLRPPKNYEFLSLTIKTPDARTFYDAMRGVEFFLSVPPPADSDDWKSRWQHLRYATQALAWSGQILQALYFGAEKWPCDDAERQRLAEVSRSLAVQTVAFAKANSKFPYDYAAHLPHINTNLELCAVLAEYACFMTNDLDQLADWYVFCFEDSARAGNLPSNTSLPREIFAKRQWTNYFPWFADWNSRAPDQRWFDSFAQKFANHAKPEVRVLTWLMPADADTKKMSPENLRQYNRWLAWLCRRLAGETEFFAKKPSQYSFQVLVSVSEMMNVQKDKPGVIFPTQEWDDCRAKLLAAVDDKNNASYNRPTKNVLQSPVSKAQPNASTPALPPLTDAELGRLFALTLTAPPPAQQAARKIAPPPLSPKPPDAPSKPTATESPLAFTIDREQKSLAQTDLPAADFKPSNEPVIIPKILELGDYGKLESVFVGQNSVWLMLVKSTSLRTRETALTWLECDGNLRTIRRTVSMVSKLHYVLDFSANCFTVSGKRLYLSSPKDFLVLNFEELTVKHLPLPDLPNAKTWLANGKIWLSGEPGIIYACADADGGKLDLISSSMRRPAQNQLDGGNAYSVGSIFGYEGKTYVWVDWQRLLVWSDADADWHPVYSTADNYHPNRPYPLTLALQGIGGCNTHHYDWKTENIMAVLAVDEQLRGVMRPAYLNYPMPFRLPNGKTGSTHDICAAAFDGNNLYFLYNYSSALITRDLQRKTAPTMRQWTYRNQSPSDRIVAVPGGLILWPGFGSPDENIYFLPVSR